MIYVVVDYTLLYSVSLLQDYLTFPLSNVIFIAPGVDNKKKSHDYFEVVNNS